MSLMTTDGAYTYFRRLVSMHKLNQFNRLDCPLDPNEVDYLRELTQEGLLRTSVAPNSVRLYQVDSSNFTDDELFILML